MAEIKVTTSEVRNKEAQLQQQNAEFRAKVQQLVDLEGALGSGWEGDAKNAFRAAFNNDKAQWDNFAALIDKYCQALEQIATEYDNKEAMNANIASQRSY